MSNKNIVWHDHRVTKEERSLNKGQKPCILWFTGLSGSGKSTIANAVEARLNELQKHTYLLDGDNIRMGLNKDLGFTDKDRIENIRRIGEVSKLFVDAGIIVLTAFISPFQKERDTVRKLVGNNEFIEVFIDTPLKVCESRDPKGLYKKARTGEITNFTGISSPYEAPKNPEIYIPNDKISLKDAVGQIVSYLEKKGYLKLNNSISGIQYPALLNSVDINEVMQIAKSAGDAIMKIYNSDFKVEHKDDKSPLTKADLRANKIIVKGLETLNLKLKNIPIMSEEGKIAAYQERKHWEYYWCIDPIDGTKEFIKKNGEFTVNIALIYKDTPLLGVVYAPALGDIYWAVKGKGAFKATVNKKFWMLNDKEREKFIQRLPLKQNSDLKNQITIVASKSHLSQETQEFIDNLTSNIKYPTLISKGSSLKLIMVAEGLADIYPRLAPTMEWDTAAADAIVREAGKMTYQFKSDLALVYNKENLLNPWFIVK